MGDPRWANGNARRKAAKRFAAMNAPCALCHGLRGDIHYNEPRDHLHPLSLAIDEIRPVSRWAEFGYNSAKECATDVSNWSATHQVCNAQAGDKRNAKKVRKITAKDATSGTF